MPNIFHTIYRIYIHIYSYSCIYISLGSFGRKKAFELHNFRNEAGRRLGARDLRVCVWASGL